MGFKRTARAWREQYDAIAAKAHTYVEQEIVSRLSRHTRTHIQLTIYRLKVLLDPR